MKKIILLFLFFNLLNSFGQNDSLKITKDYSFIIQDSPSQLFTMRQFNQSYLSGYRLLARGLYSVSDNEKEADLIQMLVHVLFLAPLTHEEGHRSILTGNNIGSISQPYFNEYGAAYVKGVKDLTLKNLRDNDLPNYIRLHTAGLESDYMLTKRVEALGSFELDDFCNYKWEYWIRKFAILQYYIPGLFKYEIDLDEETDELQRDIVGHDLYGATRHLYRPTMDFYRYTRYKDLTGEERKFVNRIGYRSLLNLLNPLLYGKSNFYFNETTKFNIGMGYTMSPFGDFIDENIWIKHKNLNIGLYVRQFQNKESWFNGFGVSLNEFQLIKNFSFTLAGHFWQQPVNLDFNATESFTGGAIDADFKYWFINKRNYLISAYSIDLGLIYKTQGFLPEELNLDEHFGVRIGISIRL
jgi:hypothetical protein